MFLKGGQFSLCEHSFDFVVRVDRDVVWIQ